jgi:hypothetical protein
VVEKYEKVERVIVIAAKIWSQLKEQVEVYTTATKAGASADAGASTSAIDAASDTGAGSASASVESAAPQSTMQVDEEDSSGSGVASTTLETVPALAPGSASAPSVSVSVRHNKSPPLTLEELEELLKKARITHITDTHTEAAVTQVRGKSE